MLVNITGNMCHIGRKVSFVNRREQPIQDGPYEVEIVGQNPKGTVNFLHIVKSFSPYMDGDTYVHYEWEDDLGQPNFGKGQSGLSVLVEKRTPNGWSFRYGQRACGDKSYFVYSCNGKQIFYELNEVPDDCPVDVLEVAANDWRLGCPGSLFGFSRDGFRLAPLWKKACGKGSLVVKNKVNHAFAYFSLFLFFLEQTKVELIGGAVRIRAFQGFQGSNGGVPTLPEQIELAEYWLGATPENRFSSSSAYFGDEDIHGERVNISFGGGFAGWKKTEIPKGFQLEFSTMEKYVSDLRDYLKQDRELVEKTISILEDIAAG